MPGSLPYAPVRVSKLDVSKLVGLQTKDPWVEFLAVSWDRFWLNDLLCSV